MTIPANTAAEATPWGSTPVTPVWGSQGGPYTVTGQGANALPVQGPTASGAAAVANPLVIGGLDGNGNVQAETLNQDLTLLTSAARTATTASAQQANQNARGVAVTMTVTVASGTGGLVPRVQYLDPASGNWVSVNNAPTAVTATGTTIYMVYPGVSSGNATQFTSNIVPRTWRVQVTHNDSSSYTYTVGASLIL